MRTLILVHGAWHGPWCWAPVLARLDEAGIPARAVELRLRDLHDDAALVRAAVDDVGGPVALVGHSYGGLVITEAGAHPAVERLVYVCAFAPDTDETALGLVLDHQGDTTELPAALVLHDDDTNTIDPALAPSAFYHDCSPADVERALALLRPQGGQTFSQPVTDVAWTSVPSTYLVCGADRAVPPSLQREMAGRLPVGTAVVELPDSSHSPFLSRPAELTELLVGVATGESGES